MAESQIPEGFEPVEPSYDEEAQNDGETAEFDEGDCLLGTLIRSKHGLTDDDRSLYIISPDDCSVPNAIAEAGDPNQEVWGCYDLNEKLEDGEPGDQVFIRYDGMEENNNGYEQHQYAVAFPNKGDDE
jgi:hypothetical protein